MLDIKAFISQQVQEEGRYSNDPDDPGGETMWGWTKTQARAYGYMGEMKDLQREEAIRMFIERYYVYPRFDWVVPVSEEIGKKLVEIGINMGQSEGVTYLQRALNVLNNQAKLYPDIRVDGGIGKITIAALNSFLAGRGKEGERVLLEMIKAQQRVRYMEIAESNPKWEKFEYGVQLNRV